MYGSLQELCELEEKSGKPFWKIVQEDDCREQGITEEVSFEQMRAMYQAMKDADARYDEKLKFRERTCRYGRQKDDGGEGRGNFALWRFYRESHGEGIKDQ